MTKRRFYFMFFLLICFSLTLTATAQTVTIPDDNLRAKIEEAFGKTPGEAITAADMAKSGAIRLPNSNIRDLTGLEYATNLSVLNLGAVRGATGFTNSNSIQDISPLAGLNKLTDLRLERNSILDISPLEGLTNLETLFLWGNIILDISPLEGLTNLALLDLSFNFIYDISSLSGLTDLALLGLQNNSISDLTPLVKNTGLGRGDSVFATGNLFSYSSLHTHIPTLQSRGVDVRFDPRIPVLQKISGVVVASSDSTLIVEVRDTENEPFEGVPVTFTVTSGGGTLSLTNTTTDENGRAESVLTPGTDGVNSVEVSAAGAAQTVTFTQVVVSVVNIRDANLRAAIENELGKTSGAAITTVDMETLTELRAPNADITDLTGLEFATNLIELYLGATYVFAEERFLNSNSISDISPLAGLTKLVDLGLGSNSISDISPLAGLNSLEILGLEKNSITNISPLSGLTNLTELYLSDNSISNISPLAGLTNLTDLELWGNSISSISPLAGLNNLEWLWLEHNNISDISPLAGLNNLERLDLDSNSISDISPLDGLNNLTFLALNFNSISDISPIAGLTNLRALFLWGNSISDILPLAGLTNLVRLDLEDNSIADISPLVANIGLGSGDEVWLRGNPLNSTSINTHIPALQRRGVDVRFDEVIAEPVVIPDDNLRAAIERTLGKAPGAAITTVDMAKLTRLVALNDNISDLTGLEHAANLTQLGLGPEQVQGVWTNSNSITDISALQGLTKLEVLDLDGNSISNISALERLTNLTLLDLDDNNITDISPLLGLTNLTRLGLRENSISDISAVKGLTNLTLLELSGNPITDISAVAGLTNLTQLYLRSNAISDISAVARLTNLRGLFLSGNTVSNISPLSGLNNLTGLFLSDNAVSNISPLSGLNNLTHLTLSGNSISDISVLSGLNNLTQLALQDNSISDISPLVANTGLGSGDTVDVSENPLNAASINTHIPALESRGVTVEAEDLKPTTSEYTLTMPVGISLIHLPLKVTAVNRSPKTIESISELYDILGGAGSVNFLITYDSQAQEWRSYFGTSDKGGPGDRVLTDDIGIIAGMIYPRTTHFSGNPLGINGSSTITLKQGLNVVGLPLDDSRIERVSDLFTLDGIRGNVPVIILTDGGEFKLVGRAGDPGDIAITGGQAFIMTASQDAMVAISGDAWANGSGTAAAAPPVTRKGIEVGNTTPVLGLRGAILDEGTGLNNTNFRVTVKNISTGGAVAAVTAPDEAGYRSTVVDIETGRAATVGDILEISARSPNPFIGVEPLRYTVTAEDVKQSLIQLPELVAYEIPAETELLRNYPNPFNPETWIPYRLAEDAFVTLTIYDPNGQIVREIDVGHQTAAVYENRSKAVYWDGRNGLGEQVASGVYFYHLSAGDYSATQKMLILK